MFWQRKQRVQLAQVAPDLRMRVPALLSPGKWVTDGSGRVGIIFSIAMFPDVQVALTDETGHHKDMAMVNYKELKLATCDEIPAPRRPDRETAAMLGYL